MPATYLTGCGTGSALKAPEPGGFSSHASSIKRESSCARTPQTSALNLHSSPRETQALLFYLPHQPPSHTDTGLPATSAGPRPGRHRHLWGARGGQRSDGSSCRSQLDATETRQRRRARVCVCVCICACVCVFTGAI